jgi:hypothetical protein
MWCVDLDKLFGFFANRAVMAYKFGDIFIVTVNWQLITAA